ncbi:GNAT family N-acetyltransferase [Nocardioides sp. KR10-350]|uniref:GNAT family N-acetyltransferase n=1 Tax=Nocardioides cheoyonin TaxID=3156615 RepID=UPI0032B3FDF2
MTPEIRQVPYDHPDARLLVERVQEYYLRIYGGRDDDPTEAAMFTPPSGAFFVGYVDGVPVTTGAWRGAGVPALGTTRTAELKRMYVVPEQGRRGYARRMLAHLEDAAAAAGYEALVLSTGPAQHEAIALYRSAGYVDVEPFGFYGTREFADVAITFLGKPLPSSTVTALAAPAGGTA